MRAGRFGRSCRRRWSSLLAVALLALTGTDSTASAPDRGTVLGRVTDGSGGPVDAVQVRLLPSGAGRERQATTAIDGRFWLGGLEPGRYRLTLVREGYQFLELPELDLGPVADVVLELTLLPAAGEEWVLASRGPAVDASSVRLGLSLTGLEIAPLPVGALPQPLPALLPGASTEGSLRWPQDGAALSLWGVPPGESGLTVDGLELPADVAVGRGQGTAVTWGGWPADQSGSPSGTAQVLYPVGSAGGHGTLRAAFGTALTGSPPTVPRGEAVQEDRGGELAASLSGPLAAGRLWGDAAVEGWQRREDVVDRSGTPLEAWRDRDRHGLAARGAIRWQPAANVDLRGAAQVIETDSEGDVASWFAASSTLPGATDLGLERELHTTLVSASWDAVLSARVAGWARVGASRQEEELDPDLPAPSYQDLALTGAWSGGIGGGVFFGGSGSAPTDERHDRRSARAGLDWWVAPEHELRVGGEVVVDRLHRGQRDAPGAAHCLPFGPEGARAYDPGSGQWQPVVPDCDVDGDGALDGRSVALGPSSRFRLGPSSLLVLTQEPGRWVASEQDQFALFVEDEWQPLPHLTLRLGLRVEATELEMDRPVGVGERQKLSLSLGPGDQLGPRLGLAFDFTGDGRSRAFAHWGRFTQRLPADPDLLLDPDGSFALLRLAAVGQELPGATNPGLLEELVGVPPLDVDPELAPARLEELVLGVELELLGNLTVGAARLERKHIRTVEAVSLDGGGSYLLTNPGRTFTVMPGAGYTLTQPVAVPAAVRTLRLDQLWVHRRLAGGWQLLATATRVRLAGNLEGYRVSTLGRLDRPLATGPALPSAEDGVGGPLSGERRFQLALLASRAWSSGLEAGAHLSYRTGLPLSRLGALAERQALDQRLVDGRGRAGRGPSLLEVDLRLSYPVGPGSARAVLEVLNLLDRRRAVVVDQRWTLLDQEAAAGLGSEQQRTAATWGLPLEVEPPRRLMVGFELSW